jgi:single-strand DNA-binding protein
MVDRENHVFITGNLTRDPELKATPNGTPVCVFSIASNYNYKLNGEDQREVSFFQVETWSSLAENCGNYLIKGQHVRIVGRLQQDRWENSEGKHRERVKIVANEVKFGSKPKSDAEKQLETTVVPIQEEDLLKAV